MTELKSKPAGSESQEGEKLDEAIKDFNSPSIDAIDSIQSDDPSAVEKNVLPKDRDEDRDAELPTANITRTIYLAFAAMCVVDLTEALDATSIAVVLPVGPLFFPVSSLLPIK